MIIVHKNIAFKSNYFSKENHFKDGVILIIETTHPMQYSIDGGETWKEMQRFNL